ncbi:ATP-grasp domain-containing protein [Shimazuella kribbensis]|uniref:ATP-grasp domain-containing protein n=1 Tax=Shimazuella kribbensis TaxID=139808 RepID=UPI0003F4E5CD|nr:ATP-grasp domain-containing protein [Shimazuella kribbensis]
MSILILNFAPHERTPYEKLFASLDEPLVLITSRETASSYPKDAFAHMEIIDNYLHHPLVYHRAIQLHRTYSFRKVVAAFEGDIVLAAKLREYFHIDGQHIQSAMNYRDKVTMKDKVAESGLRVPKYNRINDIVDLHTFLDSNRYPVIVKPIDGFGSIGTTILHTEEELDDFIKQKPDLSNLEVEEFINGTLHTVDGIVKDGEIAFICVSEAVGGNFIDLDHSGITGSFQLHPQNPLFKRMTAYCKKVIEALETPSDTAFHAEIFYTQEDDIVLCEIASRPCGAHIAPSAYHTFGIDMTQAHVQLQAGAPYSFSNNGENHTPSRLSAWLYFNGEQGKLLSLPEGDPPEGVFEYCVFGKVGQSFAKDSYAFGRIAHMLLEAPSELQLKKRIQNVCQWFTSQVSWDLQ